MHTPPQVLIVDDLPSNVEILEKRLAAHGYAVRSAGTGAKALAIVEEEPPDLILLDIMMPELDGIEVCRRIKANAALPFIPIILVTAKTEEKDVVAGLEAGAEEYLTKPVEPHALVARVRSMLRIKELQDKTSKQAAELAALNASLERRVAEQLAELERISHLKRFFSPQLAELIVSGDQQELMESHRREIAVVFCDLRRFTAFSEAAEPEEQVQLLREYHEIVGALIFRHEATLEHIAGDGIMSFFNDPVPCSDPALRAVRMAIDMRSEVGELLGSWGNRGFELGFGVGIALGYATLGQVGFEGQFHYMAVGSVANVAARLCDHARDGQILVTQPVRAAVESAVDVEPIGELECKGIRKPVPTFNVLAPRT